LVNLMVFIFFFPDTNARRPGRCAGGRRTWISLPSIRSVIPLAAAQANTSARVDSRWPCGVAYPRPASSGRTSRTARVTVERCTPYITASAACGTCSRSTASVTSTRSVNTSS
jgi:hypothetical protein